jgi:hypothetical protein
MVVSDKLKKHIVVEIFALLFLIAVIIYSVFAIDKSQQNKISSQDGLVLVLDDSKFKKLEDCSDGVGLGGPGTTYTVTNNNSNEFSYNVIVIPSVKDKELLKQIRVSVDDVFIDEDGIIYGLNFKEFSLSSDKDTIYGISDVQYQTGDDSWFWLYNQSLSKI